MGRGGGGGGGSKEAGRRPPARSSREQRVEFLKHRHLKIKPINHLFVSGWPSLAPWWIHRTRLKRAELICLLLSDSTCLAPLHVVLNSSAVFSPPTTTTFFRRMN